VLAKSANSPTHLQAAQRLYTLTNSKRLQVLAGKSFLCGHVDPMSNTIIPIASGKES
jgi:hypothetical protein